MPVRDLLQEIGLAEEAVIDPSPQTETTQSKRAQQAKEKTKEAPPEPKTYSTEISIHTISLPERAPKKLLLDLKHVLETFPGKEKVQLKIGEQIIPLPLTINMSTILEKKIEDVLAGYISSAA